MKATRGFPLSLVVVVILLGIALRWTHLDTKVYWVDEVHTSTRIAGYTRNDVQHQIFDQDIIRVESLRAYQVPAHDQPLSVTWQALKQHPEHPPLYFLLGRLWLQGWLSISEDWVVGLRSLAALLSLAVLPALYWLCQELFVMQETRWMAIAIFSISPLHILYGQEARQYSLFTLATVLASAAFLRAVRRDRPLDWVGYAVMLVIGFYSHLLFGLVAIAHGVYLLAIRAPGKSLLRYCMSVGVGLLCFLPWLRVLILYLTQVERAVDATQRGVDFGYLMNVWMRSLSRVFFSTDLGTANLLFVALLGYALYRLWRDTPQSTWVFVVLLIGVPALPLMLADGMTGGISSTRIRYLVPSYVGIQLAIAHVLTYPLVANHFFPLPFIRSRQFWGGLVAVVMGGMVVASVIDAGRGVSWTKSDKGAYYPAIAMAINEGHNPVVVSDSSPTYVLALGRLLNDDVSLNLVTRPNAIAQLERFDDIFIFDPSPRLHRVLERRFGYPLGTVVEQNDSFQLLKVL